MKRLLRRVRALFLKESVEGELDAELQFHIDHQIERHIAAGLSPEEARYRAQRDFGGVAQVEEQCRDARRVRLIENLFHDTRYGIRQMLRNPGFAVAAVATLALGIGASTALVSIANQVLLRPLPYRDPGTLVQVWQTPPKAPEQHVNLTPADFFDFREQARALSGIASMVDNDFNWTGAGEAVKVAGSFVSANLLDVLGVRPALGRGFRADEDQPGKPLVIVLSHGLWHRRFGASADVLGRAITLDGKPRSIVGVLPPDFYPTSLDILAPGLPSRDDRFSHYLLAVARLAPNTPIEQARAEMATIAQRLAAQYPQTNRQWSAALVPLREEIAGPMRPAVGILLGAVGLVLLVACANVANLMLARGALRRREMAIRASLGAARGRLVRQLLAEGLVLSLAAGAIAVVIAQAVKVGIVALLPAVIRDRLPFVNDLAISPGLVFTALAISLLTVALVSLVPAFDGSKLDARRFTRSHRLSGALVVGEAALAVLLVVGAGLALRSLMRVLEVHPGFAPQNLLGAQVALPQHKYAKPEQIAIASRAITERLRSIPGATSAAVTLRLPLTGSHFSSFGIEGRSLPAYRAPACEYYGSTPNYFETIGTPLLRGRAFTATDDAAAPRVVLVNETLSRSFFANENPIGRRIMIWRSSPQPREIVGVVGDIRQGGLDAPMRPMVYMPWEQELEGDFGVVVRSAADPRALVTAVRAAIAEVDPDIVTHQVRPMTEVLSASPSVALRRVPALMIAILAGIAVLLAGVGIAGVLASVVNRRTQEIGVRMALGARPIRVAWMVLRQSLSLVAIGLVIGLGSALALSRAARAWVFGISPTDLVTFVVAPLVLLVVAIVAGWLPARRAASVDPAVTLRCD